MTKAVCILSGGMDSTTLLYDMVKKYKVEAISFDYGQKHFKELRYARKTCEKLGVKCVSVKIPNILGGNALTEDTIDVPEGHYADANMKTTVVPNRNSIFINLAIGYAISIGATVVGYGAHAGDHTIYPDCRPVFLEAMREVAKLCDYTPIEIYAPFINMTKGEVAVLGKELGVDFDLTWSCYKGGEEHCGKCGTCVERIEALKEAFK
jgi:7-cyano-7-deazaguanine synthase